MNTTLRLLGATGAAVLSVSLGSAGAQAATGNLIGQVWAFEDSRSPAGADVVITVDEYDEAGDRVTVAESEASLDADGGFVLNDVTSDADLLVVSLHDPGSGAVLGQELIPGGVDDGADLELLPVTAATTLAAEVLDTVLHDDELDATLDEISPILLTTLIDEDVAQAAREVRGRFGARGFLGRGFIGANRGFNRFVGGFHPGLGIRGFNRALVPGWRMHMGAGLRGGVLGRGLGRFGGLGFGRGFGHLGRGFGRFGGLGFGHGLRGLHGFGRFGHLGRGGIWPHGFSRFGAHRIAPFFRGGVYGLGGVWPGASYVGPGFLGGYLGPTWLAGSLYNYGLGISPLQLALAFQAAAQVYPNILAVESTPVLGPGLALAAARCGAGVQTMYGLNAANLALLGGVGDGVDIGYGMGQLHGALRGVRTLGGIAAAQRGIRPWLLGPGAFGVGPGVAAGTTGYGPLYGAIHSGYGTNAAALSAYANALATTNAYLRDLHDRVQFAFQSGLVEANRVQPGMIGEGVGDAYGQYQADLAEALGEDVYGGAGIPEDLSGCINAVLCATGGSELADVLGQTQE